MNTQKDHSYYSFVKPWMFDWFPKSPCAILDMGCAAGAMGQAIRERNLPVNLIGIELSKDAAQHAAPYYDSIHQGDVEDMNLPYSNHFDIVICADILEHLRNPWAMLARIKAMLKHDGLLLCSIPNIRYWRILKDLVFSGSWKYEEEGILDNTHLRFFTRKSFCNDLKEAGFEIKHCSISITASYNSKQKLLDKMLFHKFSEFLGSQIRYVAQNKVVNS
jgi:2-polyprenyl-3-methyl-5-hydroxy-6-metoxy-1,4-benzoquinol methylase